MVILQRPMTLVHCYSIWRLFDRLWLNIYIKDNKKNSDQNVHFDSWQRTASEMTFVHLMFNSLAIITVKNVYLHILHHFIGKCYMNARRTEKCNKIIKDIRNYSRLI